MFWTWVEVEEIYTDKQKSSETNVATTLLCEIIRNTGFGVKQVCSLILI